MHFVLVDMDAPRDNSVVTEWDGTLDVEPDREIVTDSTTWNVVSHSTDTGRGVVELQARRSPEPFVIEIWNRDFEQPRRLKIADEDQADAAFTAVGDAIAAGRADGTPLLHIPASPGVEPMTVEPANTTRMVLTGPRVHVERPF
jgi:hypothetical protein